jgi:hypothetical protein
VAHAAIRVDPHTRALLARCGVAAARKRRIVRCLQLEDAAAGVRRARSRGVCVPLVVAHCVVGVVRVVYR